MVIYVITNKINGKQYVGQTIQSIADRWKFHKSKRSGCLGIKSAFVKYGIENFIIETVFEVSSIDELNQKEIEFINKFNTLAPNGYNLKTGGNRPTFCEETRKKMSESSKGRIPWNKGLTAEDPRVASYVRSGEDSSLYGKPSLAKGRKKSKEEIELHRSKLIGQKRTDEQRKANSDGHTKTSIFCNENGKKHISIMAASRDLKINSGQICHVLNGKNTHAKGYTFKRV